MATRRFCDICNEPLTAEDDKPFIRAYEYLTPGEAYPLGHPKNKAVAHVMIMNENNHALTDVCNACKLKVVNEGTPKDQVATLQPTTSFPIPTIAPPIYFEPSLPPQTT